MQNRDNQGNNCVMLYGTVDAELAFSHKVYGESYYVFPMLIRRLSERSDRINITVSERLLPKEGAITSGTEVIVYGQLRSYNSYQPGGSKLILTVFAKTMELVFDDAAIPDNPNQIYLNGFLCKPPVYRITPFGREITDLLIAVNRSYNKSDYLPSIAWGRNARFASELAVGDNIEVTGRVQSREYQKKLEDGEVLQKTAYEVSISTISLVQPEYAQDVEKAEDCFKADEWEPTAE